MTKVALITLGKLPEDAICEPMQLGYLAAYLKERGIEVKIIDEPAGDNIKQELAKFSPEFVGITATTPVVNDAYKMLSYCRQKGYTTIIGGVHASTLPEEAKQYADYVVVGEGEVALHSIVTERPLHGIIRGQHIKNIDDIPSPDRSLINMEFYIRQKVKEPVHIFYFLPRNKRLAAMITSRGCPYDCTHCHNSWRGLPARYFSADRVYNEMIDIKNKYNVDAIFFQDDDLFVNKRRMMALCEKLEKAKVNLLWAGNARVSSVDKEVLTAAYRAGCRQINFGIESGSQKVTDLLKKKTTIEQSRIAIKVTKEAGLLVYSSFMIGVPGETGEDIKKTKDFILSNAKYIDIIAITITKPYPGTALWDYCKTHNLIPESFNWDNFRFVSMGNISINEFFTHKELAKMRFWILIAVFFKFNIRFTLYYFKYPSFIASKFIEAGSTLLGLKSQKQRLEINNAENVT